MGFFNAFKGTNAYHDWLKRYGVDPYSLPANMNSSICSYANQNHEYLIKSIGRVYKDNVRLEDAMGSAAGLVVICVLGPDKASIKQLPSDVLNRIKSVAEDWKKGGADYSLDSKIVETVSNARMLSNDFANIFNSLLN